jgi:hypothetical protein
VKAFNLFLDFAKSAAFEILKEKKTYLNIFLALILLENIDSLYPFIGVEADSNFSIALTVSTTILSFIVLSQIVLIQKIKNGGAGELKYFVPTFLLYNLYTSFLFFFGMLLFIIPGFYVLFYFSLAPFVAVLDDKEHGSCLKQSKILVKKNLPLIVWASLLNLALELAAIVVSPIQNPMTKMISKAAFSLPDAFLTMVMTITTVKIYYYLKAQKTF